jgi:hypothetical protein
MHEHANARLDEDDQGGCRVVDELDDRHRRQEGVGQVRVDEL